MVMSNFEFAPDHPLQSADGGEIILAVWLRSDNRHVLVYVGLHDLVVADPRVWKSAIIYEVFFTSSVEANFVISVVLSIVERDFALASEYAQTCISSERVEHKPWPLAALLQFHKSPLTIIVKQPVVFERAPASASWAFTSVGVDCFTNDGAAVVSTAFNHLFLLEKLILAGIEVPGFLASFFDVAFVVLTLFVK